MGRRNATWVVMHGSFTDVWRPDEAADAVLDGTAQFVAIPDWNILPGGEFRRSGDDLKIVGGNGKAVVVQDYFKADRPAPLVAPDGRILAGDVVELLAGPRAAGQFAQAGAPAGSAQQQIGAIDKVSGNVTVLRGGVAVTLNAGDQILKGDVISTGQGATASIIMIDGTALNLSANTQMAMNEFSFTANATNNSSLLSLVQGSFAAIAGQIAPTGGLNIATPVATMGIRGTHVAAGCAASGCQFIATEGGYSLYDNSGNLLGTVTVTTAATVGLTAPGAPPQVNFTPSTTVSPEIQQLQQLVQQLVAAYPQMFVPTPPAGPQDPATTPQGGSTGGSGTDPSLLGPDGTPPPPPAPPQLASTTITLPTPPGEPPVTFTINFTTQPTVNQPPTLPNPIPNQTSAEDTFWTFTLPATTFADPDSASLTLSATLASGLPLPPWLSFDAGTRTFSGQPPLNFNGPIALLVQATDGTTAVANVFTLAITPVNDAPVLTLLSPGVATNEDTNLELFVGTVADPDVGDLITLTLTVANGTFNASGGLPPPGVVIIDGDGSDGRLQARGSVAAINALLAQGVTYVPDANFNGVDTFTVTVTDSSGANNAQQVAITVNPVNDAPVFVVQNQLSKVPMDGEGNLHSFAPDINANGRYVAFGATDTPPESESESVGKTYLFDRQTTSLIAVSDLIVGVHGVDYLSTTFGDVPSISADGRFVAFQGRYEVPNDPQNPEAGTHEQAEVFIYDRDANVAVRLSERGATPSINANGSLIAVENGVFDDQSGNSHLLVINRETGHAVVDIVVDSDVAAYHPGLNGTGRFVSFWTAAETLTINGVPFNTGNADPDTAQVYVYDRLLNALEKVSVNNLGVQGNGDSGALVFSQGSFDNEDWVSELSQSGRFVVFQSNASNLVAGDNNAKSDIFVYDRLNGTIERVSVSTDGTQANNDSYRPSISPDGRFIIFASEASNLVADDTNNQPDVFIHDRFSGTTTRVIGAGEVQGNGDSSLGSAISGAGMVAAFGSLASLLPGDTNGTSDVYMLNVAPGTRAFLVEDTGVDVNGDLTASGQIAFNDVDLSDTHIVSKSLFAAFDSNSQELPEPLKAALLDAFQVSVTDVSTGDGSGQVGWSFNFANADLQHLAAGEGYRLGVQLTLTDSQGAQSVQNVLVMISGRNDPPEVAALADPPSTAEDTDLVISAANGNAILISDVDAADTIRVTLTATSTLTLRDGAEATPGLIDGHGNGTSVLTLVGSLDAINAALDGLIYSPTADFNGIGHIAYEVFDGATTTAGTIDIDVTPKNDAPEFVFDSYLRFDGNDNAHGAVATANAGNGTDDPVTLEGWVRWDGEGAVDAAQIIFYNGSTSDSGFGLVGIVEQCELRLEIWHGGVNPPGNTCITLAAGEWHHLALSHDNGLFTLFVDGVEAYTSPGPVFVNPVPGDDAYPDYMQIGGNAGPGPAEGFHGDIADVRAWEIARTETQIKDAMFQALTGTDPNLAGYWPLDDGTGSIATDRAGTPQDFTLSGDPQWVISGDGRPLGYEVGDDPIALMPTVSVFDVDSTDFDGGTLTVEFAGCGNEFDILSIASQGNGPGEIAVDGTDVLYEGAVIGTLPCGEYEGGGPMIVNFNENATAEAVQALVRQVRYENTDPDLELPAEPLEIAVTLTDGDGCDDTTIANVTVVLVDNVPDGPPAFVGSSAPFQREIVNSNASGDDSATGVAYRNGLVFVVGNSLTTEEGVDAAAFVKAFNIGEATFYFGSIWDLNWNFGNLFDVGADADQVYAIGYTHPAVGLAADAIGDDDIKSVATAFDIAGVGGSGTPSPTTESATNAPPAIWYATQNFFTEDQGAEEFTGVAVVAGEGETVFYAVGTAAVGSVDMAYVVAKFDSDGSLLEQATDSLGGVTFGSGTFSAGQSAANDAVFFDDYLWVFGGSAWAHEGQATHDTNPAIWRYNADLSEVERFQLDIPGSTTSGIFLGGTADSIDSIYAVGKTFGLNDDDFLIAKFDTEGNWLWSSGAGGSGDDAFTDVIVVNGRVYAVGYTTDDGVRYGTLAEIDANSGALLWQDVLDSYPSGAFNAVASDGVFLYLVGELGFTEITDGIDAWYVTYVLPQTLQEAGSTDDGVSNFGWSQASVDLQVLNIGQDDIVSFDLTGGWEEREDDGGNPYFVQQGTYGQFELYVQDMRLGYILDNSRTATQALDFGDHVTESIELTAFVNGSQAMDREFVFEIYGANDAPVIEAPRLVVFAESHGDPFELNIQPPVDHEGDEITIVVASVPNPDFGEVQLNGIALTGGESLSLGELASLVFVPGDSVIAGEVAQFTYDVSDGRDFTVPGLVEFVVHTDDPSHFQSHAMSFETVPTNTSVPFGYDDGLDHFDGFSWSRFVGSFDGEGHTGSRAALTDGLGASFAAAQGFLIDGLYLAQRQDVDLVTVSAFDGFWNVAEIIVDLSQDTNFSTFWHFVDLSAYGPVSSVSFSTSPSSSSVFYKLDDVSFTPVSSYNAAFTGNSILIGGELDDRLIGNGGNETMTGGLGADRFEYKGGTLVITDFDPGQGDRLDVRNMGVHDLAALNSITTIGSDTVIDFGGGSSIVLSGFTTPLTAQDVIFFNLAPFGSDRVFSISDFYGEAPLGIATPFDDHTDDFDVTITSIPVNGVVRASPGGAVVSVGQVFDASQLSLFTFTPGDVSADSVSYLSYSLSDGLLTSASFVTLHVLDSGDAVTPRFISGSFFDDYLSGYLQADSLQGNGGNDILAGDGGPDSLDGGFGSDTLIGGPGADELIGGFGDDIYFYGPGDGSDTIFGFNEGNDAIDLTSFDANAVFGNFYDFVGALARQSGDDVLISLGGFDLDGEPLGNDSILLAGTSFATLRADSFRFSGQISASIVGPNGYDMGSLYDQLAAADPLHEDAGQPGPSGFLAVGPDYMFQIFGTGLTYQIDEQAGLFQIDGGTIETIQVFDSGANLLATISGLQMDAAAFGAAVGDYVDDPENTAGLDALFKDVSYHATGSDWDEGHDIIETGNQNDQLAGRRGNDTLIGNGGNDALSGGDGDDTLIGGTGNDLLQGNFGNDTFVFNANDGLDTILDFDTEADLIQLSIDGISDFNDLEGLIDDNGVDTVVDLGGGQSITVINVTGLTPENFVFQPPGVGG